MQIKRLIVNADDFGQSAGINDGIIRAFEHGILTSASLMVRYPQAVQAAAYAKNNSLLGVGLHIDLGEWIYRNNNWEILYEVVDQSDLDNVKDEIKSQLEVYTQIMGRHPTHLDSHQHVHQKDKIRGFVMELGKSLNITVRGCGNKVKYCGDFYGQSTDGFACHEYISSESLSAILSRLSPGITELACHPASGFDIESMYGIEREIELNSLCDSGVRDKLNLEKIELCSFEGIGF